MPTIHVNDVLIWYGNDLTGQPFELRRHLVFLLLRGMIKEERHDLLRYHVKTACRLENIAEESFQRIELGMAEGQNHPKSRLFPISGNETRYVVPSGIFLIKVINDPWMSAWSQSHQKEYFFHTLKRTSIFEVPKEAIANYSQCLKNSFLWCWSENNRLKSLLEYLASLN